MRVFLTGANGWVGSVIARELLSAGHAVVGLVRSKEKADALAAAGVTPLLGSMRDLAVVRKGAGDADGIIHTAFGVDFSKIVDLADEDRQAIETFGEVFTGSDRPIVMTGGVGLMPAGKKFTEDERPPVFPDFHARRSKPRSRLPSAGCRHPSSGFRARSTVSANVMASSPFLPPWPAQRVFPPTSETDKTFGHPCTGWMPRTSSASHSNEVPGTKRFTPSPKKRCRSG